MSTGARIGLAGSAVVVCIHDRVKREVTTEAQVMHIGAQEGYAYDPSQHRLWECACCENLFVDPSDEPRLCRVCMRLPQHPPAGPLAQPNGRPL